MSESERLLLYAPPSLEVPVRYVKGVGPKGEETLASSRFAIRTVQDLLQHYPRRHLDFSEQKSIRELGVGDEVTVVGEVRKVHAPPPSRRKLPVRVIVHDGTSSLTLVFFNQPWRERQLRPGTMIAAKGKITTFRGTRQMNAPLVDVIRDAGEVVRILPQYPATADIHTAWLRRIIRAALDAYRPLADPLPEDVRRRHRLLGRTAALERYHFPVEMPQVFEGRRRLVFDELFTLQCGLAYRKRRIERSAIGIAHKVEADLAETFLASLPFEPTGAQRKAIAEIEADLERSVPMHRLLQGEVGAGKTVVALYAALVAVQGGYQAAIMAPTEVLAAQHFLTISRLLQPLGGGDDGRAGQLDLFGGPEVVLLTGSVGAARRRKALERIAEGHAAIAVGTHALIQEGVAFANLGLAVVDEQHRFGVRQRIELRSKGRGEVTPDVLIMTATPIPRTLALTLYGDLDVSVLDELPKGRQPVETRVIDEGGREAAYDLVRREVASGRQAYVITPLVDESDKLEVRSAMAEAERLAKEVFPDLRVGMLHGRMRPGDKDRVMEGFRGGEIDVLISTTVVEVGVDVPNATVMLVENAERFGLSQLHQLRGRVGRGARGGVCILVAGEDAGDEGRRRLRILADCSDGFRLAEADLEFRGPGELLGVRQSGLPDPWWMRLFRNRDLLEPAREEAFRIDADPGAGAEREALRRYVEDRCQGRFARMQVG